VFLPKRRLIASAAVALLILFLCFLSYRNFTYTIRASVTDVSSVPLLVIQSLAHEVRAVIFFHRSYWQALRLRQENESLKEALRHSHETLEENSRFKQLLDLREAAPYQTVAASVIGKDFNVMRSYLVLNKGAVQGIKKYAPVLTYAGLAGKILEVGRFSSKVMLMNDPDLGVPAMNARTREHGLVSGTLDGRCKMRFLGVDSDIREGDLVVTSGLNLTYPEGILIGRVAIVGVESSGIGKFAVLEPAVQVSSLEDVLVAVFQK
jgi:rod shape-determining protein MreC